MVLKIDNYWFDVYTDPSITGSRWKARIGNPYQGIDQRIAALIYYIFICKIWFVYIKQTHREISLTREDGQTTKMLVSLKSVVRRRYGQADSLQVEMAELRKMDNERFAQLLFSNKIGLEDVKDVENVKAFRLAQYGKGLLNQIDASNCRDYIDDLWRYSSNFNLLCELDIQSWEIGACFSDIWFRTFENLLESRWKESNPKTNDEKATDKRLCSTLFIYWTALKTIGPKNFKVDFIQTFIYDLEALKAAIEQANAQLLETRTEALDERQQRYVAFIRANPPKNHF